MSPKITLERMEALAKAWRNNTPPKFAAEWNETLPLLDSNGEPMGTFARIRWDGVRERYEMEPVTEIGNGIFKEVALVLEEGNFVALQVLLRNLGIVHTIRVHLKGTAKDRPKTTLPSSFFPTLVSPSSVIVIKFTT